MRSASWSALQVVVEEDGDVVGDELAHDLPHVVAATRVEAGGRFVEEDDQAAG